MSIFAQFTAKESSSLLGDEPGTSAGPTRLFSDLSMPIRAGVLIFAGLSFILNVFVLFPSCTFIYLDAHPDFIANILNVGPYNLFHTIHVLEEHGCWFLAFLVIGFSVIFPFVKLIWVALLLALPTTKASRARQLKWLGQLGRWSLLDVLVVMLLLIVICDQSSLSVDVGAILGGGGTGGNSSGDVVEFGIETDVGEGLFLFPLAILYSIAAVAILELSIDPIKSTPHEAGPPQVLALRHPPSGIMCALSSTIGFVSTIAYFFLPLLEVQGVSMAVIGGQGFLPILNQDMWSVYSGMYASAAQERGPMVFFALMMLVFLLLTPLLFFGSLLWMQLMPRDHVSIMSLRVATFTSTLCLPEVLWFAYVVFLFTISPQLITVATEPGFFALCIYMFCAPIALTSAHYTASAVTSPPSVKT
jgi:hypothetical protein